MANEKRLIYANDLLEHFKFRISPESLASHSVYLRTISDCVDIARKIIKEAPTVDAVEVVHGRWEDFCGDKMCCCSVCKAEFDNTCNEIHCEWHYCPNCGAKMDGDGND